MTDIRDNDDDELLRRYARGGPDAEDAFAELVRRHAGWVYAVARRRVGEREMAQDVAQATFIVLSQKGKRLPPGAPLAPWLFKVTRFAAGRALRDQSRRRRHEARRAAQQRETTTAGESDHGCQWEEIAPALDRAVEGLGTTDRRAVLLRYFQQLPLAQVGRSLGISEDAARKRVARAVDRLRHRLASQGVRGGPRGLAGALLAGAMEAAADASMASHAAAWAAASLAAQNASTTSLELAKGAIKMILWNNARSAAAAMLALAAVIGGVAAGVHAVVAPRPAQSRSVQLNAAPATPANASPAVTTVETQGVLLAVSPDKKQLAAFSKQTGGWMSMPHPAAGPATTPAAAEDIHEDRIVVSETVGTYRDKRRVHAFSAVTGTWDTLTVSDGGPAPEVWVDSTTAKVFRPKTIHIFSVKTGKWSEPPFQERE